MTELELPGDIGVALSHVAAYGLAAILEATGCPDVTLRWTPSLNSRAVVTAPGRDPDDMASAVLAHARQHAGVANWTAATVVVGGATAGRLSPRIKSPADEDEWRELARLRRQSIDEEVSHRRWLDLRMLGALGEPAYWRLDAQGARRPDEGASRWEMKTRNRGEDFVQHRLRRLALSVADRDLLTVRDGLTGTRIEDETGGNALDSRTGTGLAGPGPVDNALTWCALWGLSRLPVVAKVGGPSESAGHLVIRRVGASRQAWFHLPVPHHPVTLSRLGTLVASEQLAVVVRAEAAPSDAGGLEARSAREWLIARGAGAVVRFPVWISGNASAPERRALLGSVIRLAP